MLALRAEPPRESLYSHATPALQDLALAPASLTAYHRSLTSFLTYTRLTPQQLLSEPASRLDRRLAVYIQHSYDTASPFTYASHALHAVIHRRPDVKAHMFVSRQCLKGWERVKSVSSHPPLTWEITVAIACTLARSGFHGSGIAMLVAFDCYLRVGELTKFRLGDIIMPSDARMGSAHTNMAVCLAKTKTGINQFVSIDRPEVAEILCAWVRTLAHSCREPNPFVFAFTPAHLRGLMRDACVQLGIGHAPMCLIHSVMVAPPPISCELAPSRGCSFAVVGSRWSQYVRTSMPLVHFLPTSRCPIASLGQDNDSARRWYRSCSICWSPSRTRPRCAVPRDDVSLFVCDANVAPNFLFLVAPPSHAVKAVQDHCVEGGMCTVVRFTQSLIFLRTDVDLRRHSRFRRVSSFSHYNDLADRQHYSAKLC